MREQSDEKLRERTVQRAPDALDAVNVIDNKGDSAADFLQVRFGIKQDEIGIAAGTKAHGGKAVIVRGYLALNDQRIRSLPESIVD